MCFELLAFIGLQTVVSNCTFLQGTVLIIVRTGFSDPALEEFHTTMLMACVNTSN
jgi:hypothetical protein